jgi:hypothetical protein
MDMDY